MIHITFFSHYYAYNVHLSNIISILRLIILVIQSFLLDVESEIDIVRINVERLSDSVASVLSTDTRRTRHKHLPLYIFLIHFLIKITNLLPNNTRGVLLGRMYIFFLWENHITSGAGCTRVYYIDALINRLHTLSLMTSNLSARV